VKHDDPWEVYIVQTKSGKLYTGITVNVERRLHEHAEMRRGARFFRMSPPDSIVFREKHSNRAEATVRELGIKRMSRRQKLELIRAYRGV
jgi:putative endonuclease